MTRKNYSKGADRSYRSSDSTWRAWARDQTERAVNGNKPRRRRARLAKQLARARPESDDRNRGHVLQLLAAAKTEADVRAVGEYAIAHLSPSAREQLRPAGISALARVRAKPEDTAAAIARYRQLMQAATTNAELMRVLESATRTLSKQDREALRVDVDEAMERVERLRDLATTGRRYPLIAEGGARRGPPNETTQHGGHTK